MLWTAWPDAPLTKLSIAENITILFSPGAASFDQYKNFEERGNNFKKIISKYYK